MTPRQSLAAAMAAAALALWADLIIPGSFLAVHPSGPAIMQTLPD